MSQAFGSKPKTATAGANSKSIGRVGTAGASVSIKTIKISPLSNLRLTRINLERCKLNIQRSCHSHEEIQTVRLSSR